MMENRKKVRFVGSKSKAFDLCTSAGNICANGTEKNFIVFDKLSIYFDK